MMFYSATNFNSNIGNWDVSNVTNMNSLFRGAQSFNNGDTGNDGNAPLIWNSATSHVTNMRDLFNSDYAFNQFIGAWDVSAVQDMGGMFSNASSFNNGDTGNDGNAPLTWSSGTGTSQVTDTTLMFYGDAAFNQFIGNWDVSSLQYAGTMFSFDYVFNNGDTGNDGNAPLAWNSGTGTSKMQDTSWMFYSDHAFNQDISNWDVSSVTNMEAMFYNASNFNNGFHTGSNSPIPLAWGSKTSHVITMGYMFENSAFDQDISSWDVSGVDTSGSSMQNMFSGDTLSTANYDALLDAWSNQGVNDQIVLDAGNSSYCSSAASRKLLIMSNNWTINDKGIGNGCSPAYALSYSAGTGGSILGTKIAVEQTDHGPVTHQIPISAHHFVETVTSGADARSVTAIPDDGYYFVNWTGDDTSTTNPRTDTQVLGDISEIANFAAITAPSVSLSPVTNITQTSAVLHAAITDTGGQNATSEFFLYLKNSDFVAGNQDAAIKTDTIVGSFGIGPFTTSITGLMCNTEYAYGADAVNSTQDIGPKSIQTFTTLPCGSPVTASGGYGYVCQDPKAVNYDTYASNGNTSCHYSLNTGTAQTISSTIPVQQPSVPEHFRVVMLGSRGSDVKKLQKYLNTHNYNIARTGPGSSGHENIFFGVLTKKSVMKFQSDHGLNPDGIVGAKTWSLMK